VRRGQPSYTQAVLVGREAAVAALSQTLAAPSLGVLAGQPALGAGTLAKPATGAPSRHRAEA
jgi:hypothetical protein